MVKKNFLYIRGNPGVGKITVARVLQKQMGWKLFWFHDLKNAIYNIVQEHRIPRLMDEVTVPVVRYMLEKGENIIYVRPSPDLKTVENIREAVQAYPEYTFHVVQLTAPYDVLHERVISREDPYRITNKKDLDAYMGERAMSSIDDEHCVATEGKTAEDVAMTIMRIIGLQ
ncbi:MAG: hypothetical protein HZA95_00550 [Candidatus Vogelbacteria bacterium]|nr:hypothetical protein [Candidatus Vogelbacteria bacterium]